MAGNMAGNEILRLAETDQVTLRGSYCAVKGALLYLTDHVKEYEGCEVHENGTPNLSIWNGSVGAEQRVPVIANPIEGGCYVVRFSSLNGQSAAECKATAVQRLIAAGLISD
jgi:hypothetical protein